MPKQHNDEVRAQHNDEVRVMFIGGDQTVADFYRMKLQIDGYDVAMESRQAIGQLPARPHPDLIYLDLSQDRDPAGTVKAVRSEFRFRNVPLVMIASAREPDLAAR